MAARDRVPPETVSMEFHGLDRQRAILRKRFVAPRFVAAPGLDPGSGRRPILPRLSRRPNANRPGLDPTIHPDKLQPCNAVVRTRVVAQRICGAACCDGRTRAI